jgi:NADPH:quinone reductase-like Zn-dependent oxidoreductase
VEEVREIVRLMRNDLWDSVVTGAIRLPIDSSFTLDEAIAAHDHMRNNRHFGKIVIAP